jgi:hypothetical protein
LEKVDLTLEKRAMDLIWKFLTQDTQHLYAYAHRPQKAAFPPRTDSAPLPRSTPEETGVFFPSDQRTAGYDPCRPPARAQEIMIVKNGTVIAEANLVALRQPPATPALFAEQEHHGDRHRICWRTKGC